MNREMELQYMKKALAEADMVLVGIGEAFEEGEYLAGQPEYVTACEKIAAANVQWVMPYVNHLFLKKNEKLKKAYQSLERLLAGKNYFVISVCMNGMIKEAGLREERVVEPCGSFFHVQCRGGCPGSVEPADAGLLQEVERCLRQEKDWSELKQPACARCGEPVEFNSLYAEHYLEEGYQDKWNTYTKWLQGTVNKKLCILELGAGMLFAGVLRFRFEKIAGLNRKAQLIRIHRNLYQLPEEIAGRGIGISQNAVEFMAEMTEL